MALVTFKDLPDTTTPLNAANLNGNFDEIMTRLNNWGNTTAIDDYTGDLNDINQTSFVMTDSSTTNKPTATENFYVITLFKSAGYKKQIAFQRGNNNDYEVYIRNYSSDGLHGWSNWKQITDFGTLLFYNENGADHSITLNQSVAPFKYIEIFYKIEEVYSSIKVYSPHGKKIALGGANTFGTSNYYKMSSWTISGANINLTASNEYAVTSSGISNFTANSNKIYIVRVVGYKQEEV